MIRDPRPLRETPAVLAIGSNLGHRRATLDAAVDGLRAAPGVIVEAVSPFIETVALTLDGEDPTAPAYLNGVVLVRTVRRPLELLSLAHRLEDAAGRVREGRWGPRTLDIDVIAYGDETSDDETLTLPHPRAHERRFVLEPWAAVDPDAVLPGRGRVADLLAALSTRPDGEEGPTP